jgi:hypothetical protein
VRARFLAVILLSMGCRASMAGKPLPDVALSPMTGGYRVCSPRPLHACHVRAVTGLGNIVFPVADIAAEPSCKQHETHAAERCAKVGKPYDAANLKCLAGFGIFNSLYGIPDTAKVAGYESPRLTVRCDEGETKIDLVVPL